MNEQLEKQRLDVQFILQRNSMVMVYGHDDDHRNGDKQLRLKANVVLNEEFLV